MSAVSATPASNKRTASKEARRAQLIKATIRSIARHGLSDTTVATVAREAKLSQGIVNLHFQSKDRLLIETLQFVTDEYRDTWEAALESAGSGLAEQLQALLEVDYDKSVFDRDKIAVWFAFWSETKSRPTYRKLCAERDRGYDVAQGLWLDGLVSPREMNRDVAKNILLTYLSCLFPRHYKV